MIINTSELTTEDNSINGNRLIYHNHRCHCKVNFKGTGNEIEIGNNVKFPDGYMLTLPNNCKVKIDDNVSINGGGLQFCDNASLTINKQVQFYYLKRLRIFQNAEVVIGERTTIGGGIAMDVHRECKLVIGKDCMLSWDIEILCGDGHVIIDVLTGKPINSPIEEEYKTVIGDHVWIGGESCILSGAVIGTGSIVGYKSTVNKKFPDNVIVAGIPAEIVRKDVTWSRGSFLDGEKLYEELPAEYKMLTERHE